MAGDFKFDLAAKRTRLSDEDLMVALQVAAKTFNESYFTSMQYDGLSGNLPHSSTVIERFGSWKRSLELIGIVGGRERRHSPAQLIGNLEAVWKELGFRPGKRQIAAHGAGISESPYRRHWGSLLSACERLAEFHDGSISREQLLAGSTTAAPRVTIPLKDRWAVLKRDSYRCAKCGASPSSDHTVELEVDHIHPVIRGGGNSLDNLQALCRKCNQGKKDR